jgi:hypothetical protein
VKPTAFLLVLLAMLLWLLSGCASAPKAAPVALLAPPRCYALNADLQRLEPMWLARTPAGHLTLICRTDTRYGEMFVVNDRGGMVPLFPLCQSIANATHATVDFVSYPIPVTCGDSST